MRKALISAVSAVFIIAAGCSFYRWTSSCNSTDILFSTNSMPNDTAINSLYEKETGTRREIVKLFADSCSYDVLHRKNSTCVVKIRMPDLEEAGSKLIHNHNFVTEYDKLLKSGSSIDELQECILKFMKNELIIGVNTKSTEMELSQNQITASIDKMLVSEVTRFLEYNPEKAERKKDGPIFDGISEVITLDDFVCAWNGKMLVSEITVKHGSEAMNKLMEIAEDNSALVVGAGDKVYYIEYTIVNLSRNKQLTVENAFRFVSDNGELLESAGFHVVGMIEKAKIKAGGKQQMRCCLVGPNNAKLYWYADGMQGARSFNLAE